MSDDDPLLTRMFGRRKGAGGAAPGRRSAGKPHGAISLGFFGKHRKSPEHVFDLGNSAELTDLRDALYDRALRAAVDQNVWKDLGGDAFCPFNHVLIAQRNDAIFVARIAATRDGLRRTDYPMIVAAGMSGGDFSVVPGLFEVVRNAYREITQAESLQHLHELLARHREQALVAPPVTEDFEIRGPALGELAGEQTLGPNDAGLWKVMYQLQRQMGSWTASATASRTGLRSPGHMRLPAVSSWPVESATLWARYFGEATAARHPSIMAFADAGGKTIDVIVGDPLPPLLRCLHASPTAMPDATQIPYELDELFVHDARQQIRAAVAAISAPRAEPPVSTPLPRPAPESVQPPIVQPRLPLSRPLATPDPSEKDHASVDRTVQHRSKHRSARSGKNKTQNWPIIAAIVCVIGLLILVVGLMVYTRYAETKQSIAPQSGAPQMTLWHKAVPLDRLLSMSYHPMCD